MADLTTYEGLKAAIADYLGREDLACCYFSVKAQ